MLKKLKQKVINNLDSKDDKVIGRMFLNTILLGIVLAIVAIYIAVANSSSPGGASNRLENIIEYTFGFFSLSCAISLLIRITKRK